MPLLIGVIMKGAFFMSWRHIMIREKAYLSVRYKNLVIRQATEITIPLMDIASILIESKLLR